METCEPSSFNLVNYVVTDCENNKDFKPKDTSADGYVGKISNFTVKQVIPSFRYDSCCDHIGTNDEVVLSKPR